MACNTGLIITVVLFVLLIVWIITFSALAIFKRNKLFEKLSIIAPLGQLIHSAVESGPKYKIVKNEDYVSPFKKAPEAQPVAQPVVQEPVLYPAAENSF